MTHGESTNGGSEFGFPRSRRLLCAGDFARVFSHPRVSADAFFTVLMRPNERYYARLGLAISKRKVKKAVARNRIKRLVRESFRLNRSRLPAADIVVVAKPAVSAADRSVLWASLAKHWQRLSTVAECS
ncbi:MAG: ribonuclease P protein component [Methylohalobius sp. ZOD2]